MQKRKYGTVLLVAVLIVCAILARVATRYGYYMAPLSIARTVIYIGLMAAWGISIQTRIVQTQVRRYLMAVSCVIVFWFIVRSIKYFVATEPDVRRYLWYLYYIPMLLIPLLALLIAMSLGKPEHYRLPKWTRALYVPTILLLLLVLTNDLHQFVFSFPAGEVWSDKNNGYSFGYYIVFGWEAICALTALGVMVVKCRVPHSKKIFWLPSAALLLTLVYGFLYSTKIHWVQVIAGDITAAMSLLSVGIFECCIQCGLIQSNTHYEELFHASTIGALITDRDFSVACAAENTKAVDRQTLMAAVNAPVVTEDGVRISEAPIRWGHVFWEDDISPMLAVLKELDDTREELQSYGSILQEENKQKARRKKLEEQERLYNAMQEKAAAPAARLSSLARELQNAGDSETARFLLWKMAVIGAYLKRRSNLIFLADRDGMVPVSEVALCMNESMDNLRLRVKRCASMLNIEGELRLDTAASLYDFFEAAVELSMDTLSGVAANVSQENEACVFSLMIQCEDDLTALAEAYPAASVSNEDGIWYCALSVREGGNAA